MFRSKRNKKLHKIAGGFVTLTAFLLSSTTFSQWDYGGVLWVSAIAILYNALFVCFKLTNISGTEKNQIILAGNFLIFNLFLMYTKGFENNAYLPVFVFTIGTGTAFYGWKRGIMAFSICLLLSLQKGVWDLIRMHLGLYTGAFLIGNVLRYNCCKPGKIGRKERRKKTLEGGIDSQPAIQADMQADTTEKQHPPEYRSQEGVMLDGLTGLLSYNAFYRKLGEMAQKASEGKERFFLLMIDIDHFKWMNQQYGYSMGDKVLGEIGTVIRTFVEANGIAGRYGGEEFVAVLYAVSYAEAGTMADQLRMQIKSVPRRIEALQNQKLEMSVSIGMACYPEASNDIHNLVSIAEIKMHKGKELGGDRVTA